MVLRMIYDNRLIFYLSYKYYGGRTSLNHITVKRFFLKLLPQVFYSFLTHSCYIKLLYVFALILVFILVFGIITNTQINRTKLKTLSSTNKTVKENHLDVGKAILLSETDNLFREFFLFFAICLAHSFSI